MSTSTTQNSLSRSRSAQSLKIQDLANQDDKMSILVQLFWICLAVLESDYEHEFLLGLRLLEKILQKLPLDRPDVREKVEKIQLQLKWPSFPGVHSLLLKGCTNPGTYEATIQALSRFTTILDFQVIDPSQGMLDSRVQSTMRGNQGKIVFRGNFSTVLGAHPYRTQIKR